MFYCWELGLEGRPALRAGQGNPVCGVSSSAFPQHVWDASLLQVGHWGFKTQRTPCLHGAFNMQMCIVSL